MNEHTCLKFTHEIETANKVSFLDVLVCKNNKGFTTSLFRKPTLTCLKMKYNSAISNSFKLNLVQCIKYVRIIFQIYVQFSLRLISHRVLLKENK